MAHGTLYLHRAAFRAVEVTISDEESITLAEGKAREYFDQEFAGHAHRKHERASATVRVERNRFLQSVTLRKGVASNTLAGRPPRPEEVVDQVVIGDEVIEMYAGRGQRFIDAEIDRRFPEPDPMQTLDFARWWDETSTEQQIWIAEFLTAEGCEPVAIRRHHRSDPQFPIQSALAELDRRAAAGWNLIQVSEDRAVSDDGVGGDAHVVRARYLMARNDSSGPVNFVKR